MSLSAPAPAAASPRAAIVLKGWPRLSETFIAQEIAALERRGLDVSIVSLRHPTDEKTHPIHATIRAAATYLPEYLWREPVRVLRGWLAARRLAPYRAARAAWLADLRRDFTPNRGRRWGQAMVLARELPADIGWLHVHFLHTPASVVRYAALLRGLPWSGSAHAKDIWTTPDWEIAEKLAECRWLATCTRVGWERLAALAPSADRVALVYHGLDLARLPPPPGPRPPRDGRRADDPVTLLSVGRRVEKKGFDDLIDALAALPRDLHWRLEHIGGGPLGAALKKRAERAGIAERVRWLGAQSQAEVFAAYRRADLFVLPSKIASDGDRDGLPNVLMEAGHQGLACVSTAVAAVPELIADGDNGALVPPADPAALAATLEGLIRDPARRAAMGARAAAVVREKFSFEAGIDLLAARFGLPAYAPAAAGAPAPDPLAPAAS